MNLQETFDTVVNHLRSQNGKSRILTTDREICLYRSPEGLKCAAGCLIPDEYYVPEMERNGWGDVVLCFDLPDHLKDSDSVDLVSLLQFVHDHVCVSFWEFKFKEIAKSRELVYKEPANV